MKKCNISQKKIMAILMILSMAIGFVACGEKVSASGPEGTFICTQKDYGFGEGLEAAKDEEYLILNSDGTGKWETALDSEITWKIKGDKITINEKVGEYEYMQEATWDGEKILMNCEGYERIFEKQSGASSSGEEKLEPSAAEEPETPSPEMLVDSPYPGLYGCTAFDVQGTKYDSTDEWIELSSDGSGMMFLGLVETFFNWTVESGILSLKTQEGLSYEATIEGDDIVLNTGMLYYFTKNDEKVTQTDKAIPAKSRTSASESIQIPSKWYGVAVINDSINFELENGKYDLWGFMDTDSDGGNYFELYLVPEPTDEDLPIVSMYINGEEKKWLTPVIGNEDAWISDHYLTKDDEWHLLTQYDGGALDMYYTYDDGVAYANCEFFVREFGTVWDEIMDPLPPSYSGYAEENYIP